MVRSDLTPNRRAAHNELRRAVRDGLIHDVRELLQAGADIEDHPNHVSLVAVAAQRGSTKIVELLIEHGAAPAWTSRINGWTAATYADANDFPALAQRLVELGAPADSPLAHGYSILHRAARRGDVSSLLPGADPAAIDAIDGSGDTPLSLAIQRRHEVVVVALLEAGANPNADQGWSVLNYAIYEDSRPDDPTHFVDRLLAAGAEPNPDGYPPLLCTVNQEWSSGAVLQTLVAAGADINATGGWQRETVLHRIAAIADADLIDTALDLGADIEARNALGRTPLLDAAASANTEALIRLIERGADANARDADGQSVDDLLKSPIDADAADEIRQYLDAETAKKTKPQ